MVVALIGMRAGARKLSPSFGAWIVRVTFVADVVVERWQSPKSKLNQTVTDA
jgi:hypothetical protein